MYRDEREVLRDEVFALRREVEQARADQEKLVVAEKELEVARRKLATLETPRSPTNAVPLIAALAVGVLVVGAGLFFVLARSNAPRPPAPPVAVQTPATVATVDPIPPVAPQAPVPAIQPPRRSAHARWRAKVVAAKGVAIAIGASCTIEGDVMAGDDEEGMGVDGVVLTCGKLVLYDESGDLEGTSSLASDSAQHAGEKKGTWTYDLVFSDVGTRAASRNQIMLDSTKKLGKVWSDNLPDMRVDLAVQSNSDPTDTAVLGE
jgi:hypothetical protein